MSSLLRNLLSGRTYTLTLARLLNLRYPSFISRSYHKLANLALPTVSLVPASLVPHSCVPQKLVLSTTRPQLYLPTVSTTRPVLQLVPSLFYNSSTTLSPYGLYNSSRFTTRPLVVLQLVPSNLRHNFLSRS